jgi:hypothetical protein
LSAKDLKPRIVSDRRNILLAMLTAAVGGYAEGAKSFGTEAART